MTPFRAHRLLHAWLAAALLLLAALAPAVSHALAAADPWGVVCSAPADGGRDALAHPLEHCPACVLQHAGGLPPAEAALPDFSAAAAHRPAAFFSAPATLHAWRPAHPRGPPVFA